MCRKIIRADVLGFCFGVRRAVDLSLSELERCPRGTVCSIGPLIHNRTFLEYMEDRGLSVALDSGALSSGETAIIRAHGISPAEMERISRSGCRVVDATCPRVKMSQHIVGREAARGKFIILTGDRNHGEVRSVAGFASCGFSVIQTADEAEEFSVPADFNGKSVLLSQTTFSPDEFRRISEILAGKIPDLAVINTICPATEERQAALLRLCSVTDGIVVVGGRASANTVRLFNLARSNVPAAVHVETADEIPDSFFGLERVGLTAGASTPDFIISEVEDRFSGMGYRIGP